MYISDSLFSCYMCSTAAESRSVRRDRNFRLARTSIATESRSVRQELARTSTATESKRVRRDRNLRLTIPSLIVLQSRTGFLSTRLLIRHDSHSIFQTSFLLLRYRRGFGR